MVIIIHTQMIVCLFIIHTQEVVYLFIHTQEVVCLFIYKTKSLFVSNCVVQVMTGYALQRRLQNVGITVSSLHPGMVRT